MTINAGYGEETRRGVASTQTVNESGDTVIDGAIDDGNSSDRRVRG